MLLHIRPRLFSSFKNVALVDLEIEPLGFHLTGDHLATRRPYPSKWFAVACRKQGQKAIDGILIETTVPVDELNYRAHWSINAEKVVTHRVHYRLLDRQFDAASDDMTLWYGSSGEFGDWPNRWPAGSKDIPPLYAEPLMEVLPRGLNKREKMEWRTATKDFVDEGDVITMRCQTFAMPTIERERLLSTKLNDRMPLLCSAWKL